MSSAVRPRWRASSASSAMRSCWARPSASRSPAACACARAWRRLQLRGLRRAAAAASTAAAASARAARRRRGRSGLNASARDLLAQRLEASGGAGQPLALGLELVLGGRPSLEPALEAAALARPPAAGGRPRPPAPSASPSPSGGSSCGARRRPAPPRPRRACRAPSPTPARACCAAFSSAAQPARRASSAASAASARVDPLGLQRARPLVGLGHLGGPVRLHLLEGVAQRLAAQRAVGLAGQLARPLDRLARPAGSATAADRRPPTSASASARRLGRGARAASCAGVVGQRWLVGDRQLGQRPLGLGQRLDQAQAGLGRGEAGGLGLERRQLGRAGVERGQLAARARPPAAAARSCSARTPLPSAVTLVVLAAARRRARRARLCAASRRVAGAGELLLERRDRGLGGRPPAARRRRRPPPARPGRGAARAGARELLLASPGVLAGEVAGRVERRDAEQRSTSFLRSLRRLQAEGGHLLLLGEHRRPERRRRPCRGRSATYVRDVA